LASTAEVHRLTFDTVNDAFWVEAGIDVCQTAEESSNFKCDSNEVISCIVDYFILKDIVC